MSNKTSRNDPCPCGSGKKYKHCHLEEDRVAGSRRNTTEMDAAIDQQDAFDRARSRPLKLGLALTGIIAAVGVWLLKEDVGAGLIVGTAWALGSLAYLTFRNPPPPNENPGDPAALNFGNRDDRR